MGKIVAIGGGENGRGEHPYETGPFDREIVRLTGKDDPNFLFIGLANSFADSYYATMCDIFHGRLGCTHTDHLTEADLRDPDTLAPEDGMGGLHLCGRRQHPAPDDAAPALWRRPPAGRGIQAGALCSAV